MTEGPAPSLHRAWVEVDHAALRHNLAALRRLAGPEKQVIAVVKANAYGHGAIEVSRTLLAEGVELLAVATHRRGDHAAPRRRHGAASLVLWALGRPEAALAVAHDLQPIVHDAAGVALLEARPPIPDGALAVHLKVDTGLGRQGADPATAVELATRLGRSRRLGWRARSATWPCRARTMPTPTSSCCGWRRRWTRCARPASTPGWSTSRPPAASWPARAHLPMRCGPGLGLYGMLPAWAADRDPGLRPALSLKALPMRIFDLPAGQPIGYGLRYRPARATRIATLGIGYGDGWPRLHANNGRVLVRGRPAPIVGAISMDGLTVDLGQIDEVTYERRVRPDRRTVGRADLGRRGCSRAAHHQLRSHDRPPRPASSAPPGSLKRPTGHEASSERTWPYRSRSTCGRGRLPSWRSTRSSCRPTRACS